jgi:galactokinase
MNIAIKENAGKTIQELFYERFSEPPEFTVNSPGRINLIGEHTDYNNGFVLPAAINKSIQFSIRKRSDDTIHLYSIDKNQQYSTSLKNLHPSGMLWPDYILGVVDEIIKAGYHLHGFSAAITGNIPIGAGLSSSAALECASAFAINELFGLGLEKIEMVRLSQRAENNFVGLQCGIMDMFASMMGREGHVIRLDCRSLAYDYFPLKIDGYKIVLLDSQVNHSLASSEYNTRRIECDNGVNNIRTRYPEVASLRDATREMIEETVTDEIIKKRCLFIVEEISRLIRGCMDLKNGDLIAFGKKMYETHAGLSQQYEVSCQELDFIANECRKEENIIGARMMGGGFGGCVISMMKEDAIEAITQRISREYLEKMNRKLKVYITEIGNGTGLQAIP